MSSSERRALAVLVAAACLASPARATDLRVGGMVGFGLEARRAPGPFQWDLDTTRADSILAVLHLGARAGALSGFVAVATGIEPVRDQRVALREASLVASRHFGATDSAAVRAFLRQPGSLWLDLPLWSPLTAIAAPDAAGGRADGAWRAVAATLLGVDAGAIESDAPLDRAWLGRVVVVAPAALRSGFTWAHEVPAAPVPEPLERDTFGFDVRAVGFGSVVAALQYQEAHARFASAADEQAQEPGLRRTFELEGSRRLTDILPSRAALRAEVRASNLRIGNLGRFGIAPSYRALGANFTDPLAVAERDFGAPHRGLEGGRLETWFEPAAWPGWLRWVYDRHITFRDTDRRVIAQELEAQAWVHAAVRLRSTWVQRSVQLNQAGRSEHHDDLVGEIVAEERGARLRLQAARVDLNTEAARTIGALEATTSITRRLQAGMRLTVVRRDAAVRRGAFITITYWHLPQLEVAAQYGSETLGDGTEPALDADLTGAGAGEDRVRLHVRGWF